MGQPSYMRSVVDRNVVMRRIPVVILTLAILFNFLEQHERNYHLFFFFTSLFLPISPYFVFLIRVYC